MLSIHDGTKTTFLKHLRDHSDKNRNPALPLGVKAIPAQNESRNDDELSLRELLVTQLKKMSLLEFDHQSTLTWIHRFLPKGPRRQAIDALYQASREFVHDTSKACQLLNATAPTPEDTGVAQLTRPPTSSLSRNGSSTTEECQYLKVALQITQTQVIEYGTARNAAEMLLEMELRQLLHAMLLRAIALRQRFEHLLMLAEQPKI